MHWPFLKLHYTFLVLQAEVTNAIRMALCKCCTVHMNGKTVDYSGTEERKLSL